MMHGSKKNLGILVDGNTQGTKKPKPKGKR